MKTFYTCLLLVIISATANAANEVPNPSFESWTSGHPTDWETDGVAGHPTINSYTPGVGSTFAIKGQPIVYNGDTLSVAVFTSTSTGDFPVTKNYAFVEFDYQANFVSNDELLVYYTLDDAGHHYVAGNFLKVNTNAGSWTHLSLPFSYTGGNGNAPVWGSIGFILQSPGGFGRAAIPSSFFILDNVSFTGTVGLEPLNLLNTVKVFPVPAHDVLTVKSDFLSAGPVTLSLTDALGRTVLKKKFNNLNFMVANFDIQDLERGIYYLVLENTDEKSSRRIVIQ